jgi:integrase
VHWRPECDKIGFDSTTFLSDVAARALELHRSQSMAIGGVWIFPAQRGESGPTSRNTFGQWFRKVELEAKLPVVKGRGRHSLRRKFATEMKHAPLKDLAYLGGWKSVATVVDIYQRPDEATMRSALAARRAVVGGEPNVEQLGTTIRHQAVEK